METPAWERLKENAAPLQRGRNVETMERHASTISTQERDQMISQYERLVRPSENNTTTDNDDPLIHWLSYIKYHQEAFVADTHGQFLLMERCVRALVKMEKYKNDVRFVRVCVLYADKTGSASDVFKYLHSQKVGSSTALFWIAWAWVAEKKGDFAFCERIYKKAISKNAVPLKLLQQRQKQFQRRMSRHWLNHASRLQEEDEDELGIDHHSARGALGNLSEHDTRVNDRRRTYQDNHSASANLSTFTVRSSSTSRRTERHASTNSNDTNKGGFEIFQDDQDASDTAHHDFLDVSRDYHQDRPMFAESEHTKENNLEAQRWNEHGGLPASASLPLPAAQHRRSNSSGPPPAFAIHVDEECAAQHEDERKRPAEPQRDERTLRQRMDGGMAERLARDPLRYVRHPSKLALDQAQDGEQQESSDTHGMLTAASVKAAKTKSDSSSGISCGFSKRLLAKDENRMEQCFEEGRARLGCFKIVGPGNNFNMLATDTSRATMNTSTMEQSVEDVEMEEVEEEESVNEALPRKALFCLNTSAESRGYSFVAHNTSTASSTVNENEAVGVPRGKEEETINTKLAMKELSMMFSSPALGLQEDTINNNDSTVGEEDDGQTATFSVVAQLMDNGNNREGSDSFVDYNDENQAPRNPAARSTTTPGFDHCALRTMEATEVEQGPRQVLEEQSVENVNSSPVATTDFEIYCDDTAVEAPLAAAAEPMAFEIYCDEENRSVASKSEKEEGKAAGSNALFEIFHDSQDQGETATLSLVGDALKELNDVAQSQPNEEKNESHTTDFRQYDGPPKSGTVLTDTAADFGDISRIVPDEMDLSHMIPRAPNSPTLTIDQDTIEYSVLHKEDVTSAMWQLQDKARELAGSKASGATPISTSMLTKRGLVYHRPGHNIPRALFRKKTSASEGTRIEIGGQTGVVKQELGRGAYGVVVLLDSTNGSAMNNEDDTIAVKAQTPTDCLAWEYVVLRRVEERISDYWAKTMHPAPFPFPRALSFVALSDGGLLGMTAGSKSGLNLVDIANIYKVKERGAVPELIALHYTARMLKHLETLHWHGKILHCDVKPDNWVLTASSDAYEGCKELLDASELMLVDFGRAVDLTTAAKDGIDPLEVKLFGDAAAKDMPCVAMRNGIGWSFDVDTYGICASAHVLLYGEHLKIELDRSSQRWRICKPFRRYWNKDLWNMLFDSLLNLDGKNSAIASRPHSLRSLRKSFESFLNEGTRTKQLESLLKHQARILPKQRLS